MRAQLSHMGQRTTTQPRSREPGQAKGDGDCKPEASLSPTWAPQKDMRIHSGRQGLSKAELPLQ